MFLEPNFSPNKNGNPHAGWIEIISGCMFSGKTEELIRRLNRAIIARQNVEIFKPDVDKRYDPQNVVSHNNVAIRSTVVAFPSDILMLSENCDVVGIDEVQFFDHDLVRIVDLLANKGRRVILSGLDMDFRGQAFETVSELMAKAEFVTKMNAICIQCGGIASYSFRKTDTKDRLLVGEKNIYEPKCRTCFTQGMKKTVEKSDAT